MSAPEIPLFSDQGVRVTRTRFTVPGGQTFAMSGITSVEAVKVNPDVWGLLACCVATAAGVTGVLGGLYLLATAGGQDLFIPILVTVFGLGFAAGFGWMTWQAAKAFRPLHCVLLRTASGEVKTLRHLDSAFVSRVVAAINEAIVLRG